VIGIGTDLVELERFRRVIGRSPGIVERVFHPEERAYAGRRADPVPSLAVRFAAKEAVMKALGVGIGGLAMRDIEVVRADSGAPSLRLHETALALATDRGVARWLLTLTHTDVLAQAIAVAL
jgi:phosphopantetheine--protein transferase-like protein